MIRLANLSIVLVLLSLLLPLNAQQVIGGAPPFNQFATYGGGGDEINLGNLDIHRDIPLRSLGAYGPAASAKLVLDTGVSLQQNFGLNGYYNVYSPSPGPQLQTSAGDSVYVVSFDLNATCYATLQGVLDRNDTYHPTPAVNTNGTCDTMFVSSPGSDGWAIAAYYPSGTAPLQLYAINPNGEYTETTGVTGLPVQVGTSRYLIFPHAVLTPATVSDQHGSTVNNTLSISYDQSTNTMSASGSLIDALGNTVLTASLPSSNVVHLTYAGPNSTTSTYVLNYTWKNIDANYGCPSNTPIPTNPLGNVPVITSITLPDQSTMAFTYELSQTGAGHFTGRISSVKLPTGATITYTYQGGTNGFNCSDGSTAGFTKATPDGTWIFSHTAPNGTTGISTTTVTAPSGDYKTYTFDYSPGTYPQPTITYPIAAVASNSNGSTLGSTVTCYTSTGPSCTPSSPFPGNTTGFSQVNVYTYVPGVTNPSRKEYLYDLYGRATFIYNYDFGATVATNFDSFGYGSMGLPPNFQICGLMNGTITQHNASFKWVAPVCAKETYAGTQLASKTAFTYDVAGNVVERQELIGSTLQPTTFTNDSVGRVLSSLGPNGETDSAQYSQCANTLQSSASTKVPSGTLTANETWNCASETLATYTDFNNQPWTFGYNTDPFWRPTSLTDPIGAVTSVTYTPTTKDVRLLVTATSVNETLSTVDSMGRPFLIQERQGPTATTYNSEETDYDTNGRVKRKTVPYSAAAGASNSTTAAFTFAYDGADRLTRTVAPLGTTKTISYNSNDTLVAITPVPSGEHTKATQYEFNGLGWLTSVCEIATIAGNYACGQTTTANGFLTTYNYPALSTGQVTSIVQNSGGSTSQTRSFTYENSNTGRLLTATLPESGTITTTYDSDSSGVCGSFIGAPVKVVDNAGGTKCLTYDLADRLIGETFPQGLNSSATPSRTLIYDVTTNANINCTNKNQAHELAEIITGPTTAPITDEGFCYDADGRPTDTFSHALAGYAGYTHITESYFANDVVHQLSLPVQPAITYNLDAMGRVKSATGGTQNLLTTTSYNTADLPNSVTLGSGDNTAYSWSNGIGPISNGTFTVGASTITHALTWYPNGSLKQLVVTDPLDPSDNQTCTFSYDDLRRSLTDNCGTAWNESFSYDPFGNVTKSGSMPWPLTGGYNQTNNQYSSSSYSYDANGRVTNDTFDTLGWDIEGNLITQSGTNLTYDALDRPVMASAAQYLYAPDGTFAGVQNSSGSITKMLVPLPMAQAVYTGGSSPAYYNRQDWQGSVRVASTANQTLYAIAAYDAFGIPYATQGATDFQYAGLTTDISSGSEQVSDTRRYHPTQGRWESPDSMIPDLSAPQTFNAYHYALNMPTSATDPGGNDDVTDLTYYSFVDPSLMSFAGEMISEANSNAYTMWNSTDIGGALYPQMIEQQMARLDASGLANLGGMNNGTQLLNAAGQVLSDTVVGGGKGIVNTFVIDLANVVNRPINLAMSHFTNFRFPEMSELQSSSTGQSSAMAGVFVVSFFSGAGEEAATGKIGTLSSDAEKLYPKLAGKFQNHHIVPKYLAGAPDGATVRLPAAYHQLITNEFRALAPYGQKIQRSVEEVGRILQEVYSKYPLPIGVP